ncbi:MAG: hypothetical protein Q7K39_00085 [Candidatus Magasanikbacteria bacterium]|nr:hypothetical protein [Candidatus Magasanikbacteria bacterium]
MDKLSQRILFLAVAGVSMSSFLFPQATLAATSTPSGSILDTLQIFGANMGLPDTDPRLIVARLVRTAMGFVGIVVVLMILSSGWSFMVSGGDEEKVKKAKRTFYNAIIGLIIMLSAYSIVAFVLRALSAAGS